MGADDTVRWCSNCDENDYDQDEDGHSPDEYSVISGLIGGDCNDEDSSI